MKSGHYLCFHPSDHDCTELLDGEFEELQELEMRLFSRLDHLVGAALQS